MEIHSFVCRLSCLKKVEPAILVLNFKLVELLAIKIVNFLWMGIEKSQSNDTNY